MDGDQVRENVEGGAGCIEFKLIAFEGEPFARESELLAGQIDVIPFEGGILVLKEHAGGGAEGGEILGGIREEPSGMIMSLAGSANEWIAGRRRRGRRTFSSVCVRQTRERSGEIERAKASQALLIETGKRIDVGANAQAIGRRLGDPLFDGFKSVGGKPIKEISLLILGEPGEDAIFTHVS
jgi:hypothetical protein